MANRLKLATVLMLAAFATSAPLSFALADGGSKGGGTGETGGKTGAIAETGGKHGAAGETDSGGIETDFGGIETAYGTGETAHGTGGETAPVTIY